MLGGPLEILILWVYGRAHDCISNEDLGDADAATAGLGTSFEKRCLTPLSGGPLLAGGEGMVKLDPLLLCSPHPHSPPATGPALPPNGLFGSSGSSVFLIHWPQAV